MTETIHGWFPPLIYDAARDEKRVATQDDIDSMQQQLSLLLDLYREVRKRISLVDDARRVSVSAAPEKAPPRQPGGSWMTE